ncbi:MAG: L-rhamnose mutarotase [Chloroflexi bacterium]|nr:MAG: L-rhamnose mutarotase [Chloroflexota bacterium]
MQSYGMTLMLKDGEGIIDRYKEYHRKAWPEVVSRLRENGIREMRIYLLGRRMFMYMEAVDGFSPERDFPKLLQDPRYREWDELMRTLQERAPEAKPEDWWAPMEEVFDLSAQ